ncbi:MAG TPA: 50S ribosomal protein L25/general stress protein Ctc [Draconibacterium sp.]|nr:50S ribosomal protein L25/general stress protein Ctc [Draconibacterium sp.]HRX10366.1 50S ribosomal protein L25/general stress protein Ctc [Draconibacterium sp.]
MKTLVVKGQKREALGKKVAKSLRSQELVPAVLYGAGEPVHFSVPFSEMRQVVYSPGVFLIDLDIDGTVYHAMMQDIQWHAVEEQILHIDFLKIEDNKKIKIDIPVKVKGLARGIKAGGKLKTNLRRLKVKALAKDLPDSIEIDVTKLAIGQSIKVADLSLKDIEILDKKTNVVVAVTITRAARSAAGMAVEEEDVEEETAAEETANE